MEYGKFNSVEELIKGYNELEKSFTQKCQQLAALQKQRERGTNDVSSPRIADEQPLASEDAENKQAAAAPPANLNEDTGAAAEVQVACAVPADNDAMSAASDGPSLKSLSPLPRVMASGGNVPLAPPTKPKTIKEASLLAVQLFKNA